MSTDGETNGPIEGTVLENMLEAGRDVRNHMLFEVSTEAANRGMEVLLPRVPLRWLTVSRAVGGIYSVIKSKAPVTTAEYGDRYTLIGPLNRASVCFFHAYGIIC